MLEFSPAIESTASSFLRSRDNRRGFLKRVIGSGITVAIASHLGNIGASAEGRTLWTDKNWFPFSDSWGLPRLVDVVGPLDDILVRSGRKPGILDWELDFVSRVMPDHSAGHCHALAIAAIYNEQPSKMTSFYNGVGLDYLTKLSALISIHSGDPTLMVPREVAVDHLRQYGSPFIANMPDEPGIWVRGVYRAIGDQVEATAWSAGSVTRPVSKILWAAYPLHNSPYENLKDINQEWRNPYIVDNEDILLEAVYS